MRCERVGQFRLHEHVALPFQIPSQASRNDAGKLGEFVGAT